ncbi:IS110 family transposase [Chromohalobacter canadensis]|uniref:IS110 family transposase n=1 Tax=Chromohalobacter canadensis TaxID=141389 RepID=UPI0021BF9401|nr:transposase [Chromohalobacter canadensis]
MAVIGIDVSKQKLDCAWLRDVAAGKVKTRVFPNRRQDFPRLLEWLEHQTGEPQDQWHVLMEATGIYHETLAHWLHAAGIQVYVLNPAQVRDFSRSLGVRGKTDKKDSVVLARYGATQRPDAWQPEPRKCASLRRWPRDSMRWTKTFSVSETGARKPSSPWQPISSAQSMTSCWH